MSRFMLLSIALTAAFAQAAMATPIPVTVENADFETPVLGTGEYVQIVSGAASNWVANDANIYVLKGAEFGLGATASNVAFFEPNANPNVATQIVYQVLMDTLKVGTYTLTVDAGHANNYGSTDITTDAKIGFNSYKSSTSAYSDLKVDTVASSLMPKGSLGSISMVMNVLSNNTHLGEQLVVVLASPYQSAGMCNVSFDNVSVTYAGVPEPSAIVLSTVGLIGLLAYAWRKRS